ncbi:MAG: hypothetical protein U9Q68_08460 [Euryarchaeota archaeon]|nr:hypothetical protein [Euryarchaeota archaeon]
MDTGAVNRVPSNDGVNLIRYSLNHEKKLVMNYGGVGYLLKVVVLICGADCMNAPRMLLEARRKSLYRDMPVPAGWHDAYGEGRASTDRYWNIAKRIYKSMKLD